MKRFDPFRRGFLDLLDHLSLRNGSRQRRDNVNVIRHPVDVHELGAKVSADCRQISVHPRTQVWMEPGLPIFRAKDDAKDDFTE